MHRKKIPNIFDTNIFLLSRRSHRRIHSDLLQSRDMLIDSDSSLASTVTKKIKCNGKSSHDLHYSYSSQQRHCGLKRCPHHVALPDNNDWDSVDSRLQLSNSYQVNTKKKQKMERKTHTPKYGITRRQGPLARPIKTINNLVYDHCFFTFNYCLFICSGTL